jgi:dienelactone hydrolase
LRAETVRPAVEPSAQFDAAHRVEFQGLVEPINDRLGTANPVQGYLFRPEGAGPFPGVVLLSGCSGLQRLTGYRRWVDRLVSWGYVVLAVDSLGLRGVSYCENRMQNDRATGAGDAYGALRFLKERADVLPDQIGAVGFSYGANALFMAIAANGEDRSLRSIDFTFPAVRPYAFRAAVAFYPTHVSRHLRFSVPLLVLDGDSDRFNTAMDLWWMAEAGRRLGDPTQLHIYLFATHGFDMEETVGGGQIEMRFDPKATADAAERVREFLSDNLLAPAVLTRATSR